ncbi:MAG: SWIM zinc finger family protein [Cyanobacteria bacterium J06592_8]|nr:SWIM zinc finger family protein [Cyanobacteriota bacterium]
MNTSPLNTPTVQKFGAANINKSSETAAQTPTISALVPADIRVERIQTVSKANIPQIIYRTTNGRCSTLISKDKFRKIWQCWLYIQSRQSSPIHQYKIKPSGIHLQTEMGHYWISSSEAKSFLSRYNRVAIEPLFVKFNDSDAVVWNSINQTISLVRETGCSCPDSQYRHTICKHQIAVQLCQMIEISKPHYPAEPALR